jgi:uncharacterized protein YsxB (DUF464 family)
MIEIRFNPKGNVLRMNGHADFNPGNDVICSAASVICYTLAQNYQFCFDRGELEKPPHIKLEGGNVVLAATPKRKYRKAFNVMVNAVLVGFVLLANQFPDNVKLVNGSGKAKKE